jgi:hypothetical protein
MNIHLVAISHNAKTGPIPVTTTSAETCPDNCAFKKTNLCYAKFGPLLMHWRRVTDGTYAGLSWDGFLAKVKGFRNGQLWRHNQAGDLPGENNKIDCGKLAELVEANRNKKGFAYTHKPIENNVANARAIKLANEGGFTVNLSADNVAQADSFVKLGIAPVVLVVPENQKKNFKTPGGNRVVICPATIHDNVTCANCGLCQWAKRKYIIAFPAHGVKKKAIGELVKS